MAATAETFGTALEEHHVSILTKCGISRVHAIKIIGMTDEFSPIQNKSAMQAGLVAAANAEIEFRAAN